MQLVQARIKLQKHIPKVVRLAPILLVAIIVKRSPVPQPKKVIKAKKIAKCIVPIYYINLITNFLS